MQTLPFVLITLAGILLSSCSSVSEQDLLVGEWGLVAENDSIKTKLFFDEFHYSLRVSPNSSNSSEGQWRLSDSTLFMTYRWLGGKDTLQFNVVKINQDQLSMYKLAGGMESLGADTLNFTRVR